jgi:hypothetical protein
MHRLGGKQFLFFLAAERRSGVMAAIPDDSKCDIVRKCLESQEHGGQIAAFIGNATPQPIAHALTKDMSQEDCCEMVSMNSHWYFYPSGFCLHVQSHNSDGLHGSSNSSYTAIGYFTVVEKGTIFVKEWKSIHDRKNTQSSVVFESYNPSQSMRGFYSNPFGRHDAESSWFDVNEMVELS